MSMQSKEPWISGSQKDGSVDNSAAEKQSSMKASPQAHPHDKISQLGQAGGFNLKGCNCAPASDTPAAEQGETNQV